MRMLLVVGATGLVGSKVVKLASNHGYEAFSTHNARQPQDPKSFRLDITNREEACGGGQPEVIVSAATDMDSDRGILLGTVLVPGKNSKTISSREPMKACPIRQTV